MSDDSGPTPRYEDDRRQDTASIWERFDHLQRTVKLRVRPKGVFRFKPFEEFDEWKEQYSIIAEQDPPEHDLP